MPIGSMTASVTGHLTLYTSRYCGYCYRLLFLVRQLALTDEHVRVIDVSTYPERRLDIIRGTGRRTVPVLRIQTAEERGSPMPATGEEHGSEEWLFESRDIARYLRTRFAG